MVFFAAIIAMELAKLPNIGVIQLVITYEGGRGVKQKCTLAYKVGEGLKHLSTYAK